MIVVEIAEGRLLHLAAVADSPLCGAPPAGALVVEHLHNVTCPVCIAVSNIPGARRARRASA